MQKKVNLFQFLTLMILIMMSFVLVGGINSVVSKSYAVGTNYTISFSANSGEGSMSNQIFTQGVAQNLSNNDDYITRENYTFAGWSTSSTGEVNYTNGDSYIAYSDATLYAVWTAEQFTISFVTNGGNEITEITQDYNSTVTLPSPTKVGYTFNGWYLDEDLTIEADVSVMTDENVTLYASWVKVEASSTLLIVLGIGLLILLIAVPTTYYFIKKSKTKASPK